MRATPGRLWLVGCGAMGGAMLRRWLASGTQAADVTVIDPAPRDPVPSVRLLPAPPAEEAPETMVLAVKPQQLGATAGVLPAPGTLVSILAGVDGATLQALFPDSVVVRAMPNLPVAIGRGVVALHSDRDDLALRSAMTGFMAPLGLVEWIDSEESFDAVTALSGCGPGFLYRFVDALADAGAALGLPADQAARLALATVEGSALLAAAAEDGPAALADRVASPGGSTRAGLNVLDEGGALRELMRRTLEASRDRNAAMAREAREGGPK